MFKVFIALLISFSGTAFAQNYQFAPSTTPTTQSLPSAAVNEGTGTTTTTPTPTAAVTPSQASINPSAAQGQQSQSGGAGANAAAAAALMAAAMPMMANPQTMPMGAALMAMGLLAMAQSGHDQGAANQSAQTYATSVNGAPTTPAAAAANPEFASGAGTFIDPKVIEAKKALAAAGYTVNGDQVTGPNGAAIPASAFSSAGGLAAAGFDPNALKEAQRITAGIGASGGKASGMAVNEGGGGSAPNQASNESSPASHYVNPFNLSSSEKKQLVAGKTVLFDGDPIGVRGQDIFDMVHTAYEKKQQRGNFLGDAAAQVRAPASTGKIIRAPNR